MNVSGELFFSYTQRLSLLKESPSQKYPHCKVFPANDYRPHGILVMMSLITVSTRSLVNNI